MQGKSCLGGGGAKAAGSVPNPTFGTQYRRCCSPWSWSILSAWFFTPCTTSTDHNISNSFANCFLACSQLIGNLMQQMQTVNATTWSYNHLNICVINVTESNLCWDAVSFDISLVDFSFSTCAVVPGRSTNHHPPKCLFCQLVTLQGCAQSEGTCCLPTALLVHFAETVFFGQGMRHVMKCQWKLWKSFAAINVMLRGSQGGLHLWLWCRSIGECATHTWVLHPCFRGQQQPTGSVRYWMVLRWYYVSRRTVFRCI